MMKKTITPVISVILLIMLTIAVSATAWYWVNNLQGSLESGAGEGVESVTEMVQYSLVGVSCSTAEVNVTIRNNGNTNISSTELVLVKIFDNAGVEEELISSTLGTSAGTSGTLSIVDINGLDITASITPGDRYRIVTDIKGIIASAYCTAAAVV